MDIVKEYFVLLKCDLKQKKGYKHIPNLLTFLRLISPLFIIPFILCDDYSSAFIVVVIAAVTDLFDGLIARRFNLTSEFGRLLDAVTDKFFSLSLLVPIVKINKIYVILMMLEVLIAVSNYIAYKKNKKPETHKIGKIKTTIEFIFISFCYLSFIVNINIDILNFIFMINIIFVLLSLSLYVLKNKQSD